MSQECSRTRQHIFKDFKFNWQHSWHRRRSGPSIFSESRVKQSQSESLLHCSSYRLTMTGTEAGKGTVTEPYPSSSPRRFDRGRPGPHSDTVPTPAASPGRSGALFAPVTAAFDPKVKAGPGRRDQAAVPDDRHRRDSGAQLRCFGVPRRGAARRARVGPRHSLHKRLLDESARCARHDADSDVRRACRTTAAPRAWPSALTALLLTSCARLRVIDAMTGRTSCRPLSSP